MIAFIVHMIKRWRKNSLSSVLLDCFLCSCRNEKSCLNWLVVFGFNGPLRQYFSQYQAVFQREGERGEKG